MTREEAIKILSECRKKGYKYTFYTLDEYHTAMDIAINSLQIDEQYDLAMEQADTVSLKAYEQVMRERDIAIQQLKELGYGFGQKIEPCGDVISRQDAINVVEDMHDLARADVLSDAVKQLKDLPPVTPKPCGDLISRQAVLDKDQ